MAFLDFLPLIGDAVNAIGGIFGQSSANETNIKLARESQAFNERMMQKQMDYNTQMYDRQLKDAWDFYNDEKQWNSASNQMKQLQIAGINPYAGTGMSFASKASAPSTPSAGSVSPAQAVTPQVQSVYDSAKFGKAIETLGSFAKQLDERKLLKEEVRGKSIENKYRGVEIVMNLKKLAEDTKDVRLRNNAQRITNMYLKDIMQAQAQGIQEDVQMKRLQVSYQAMENVMQDTRMKNFPEQQRLELAMLARQLCNLALTGNLTRAQIQDTLKSAELKGVNIKQLNSCMPFVIAQAAQAAEHGKNNMGPDNLWQAGSSAISQLKTLWDDAKAGKYGKIWWMPQTW